LWLNTTAISLQCHSACHNFLWVSIGSYSSPLASSTVHQRRCLDRLTARWKNIRNSGANGFLTSCQLVQPASLMSQYREHARFPSSNSFRTSYFGTLAISLFHCPLYQHIFSFFLFIFLFNVQCQSDIAADTKTNRRSDVTVASKARRYGSEKETVWWELVSLGSHPPGFETPSSKMAQSKTAISPVQKTIQKLEQGRYTATDLRWGMTLDLSGADDRSLIAYGIHGKENQQARAFWFLSYSTVTGGADCCPDP
jgi:hypothetical protein